MRIWLPPTLSSLFQLHPKQPHLLNIRMLLSEPSKRHNYYHQNMVEHLKIKTGPSQYGVKDYTKVMKLI